MIDVGRRVGGGGGTLTLSDLGLLFSFLLMLISSSTLGDNLPVVLLRVNFDSETSWLCRLVRGGGGAVFRLIDEDGDGGSGVFPAASLSNMDSRSASWLARGAGGRGLLRSV
jgi:hypothetical protein